MALLFLRRMLAVFLLLSSLCAQTMRHTSASVTPVTGESWLQHLHRSFDETSMGKTGQLGPAMNASLDGTMKPSVHVERQSVSLSGADLYRLNCRGCHGEFGHGAPPEINSVIDPVRSSSAVLVMERMKKVGMDMKPAEAAQLAMQFQNALLQRLQNGGKDMPAFPHLNDEEIHALMAYLRELSNVPGAGNRQLTVQETPVHIGEHIVKSTCHVCHSASGTNPDSEQLGEGAIPPLSALTSRVSESQFIRKVTQGATIEMGEPAFAYRGRMPVFYYLSNEEAADAYLYLTRYASNDEQTSEPAVVVTSDDVRDLHAMNSPTKTNASVYETRARIMDGNESRIAGMQPIMVAIFAGALMSLLLMGMAAFSVRECKRLSFRKNKAAESSTSPKATNRLVKRLESQRIA